MNNSAEIFPIQHNEEPATDIFDQMTQVSQAIRTEIGPYTKALLVELDDEIYAVDPEDTVVGRQLRFSGGFSRGQQEAIKLLAASDNRILVVGAHIGTMAIPLSKICQQVVAIEANPQSFQLLELNLHINMINNCLAYNIAANDKEEQLHFLMSRVNSGGSKRKPVHNQRMYSYDTPKEILVPAHPLDSFLPDQSFDVILIDIEGSEYFALKGMQRLLSSSNCLVVEFLPHHLKYVSDKSIADFLSVLPMYNYLEIPSLNTKVSASEFHTILAHMYNNDIADDGIIFSRE
jgi:FkbM family methyltransferase